MNNSILKIKYEIKNKNFKKALSLCNKILKCNIKNPKILYLRAYIYGKNDKFKLAESDYEKAIKFEETDFEIYKTKSRLIEQFNSVLEKYYKKRICYENSPIKGQYLKSYKDEIKNWGNCGDLFIYQYILFDPKTALKLCNIKIKENSKDAKLYMTKGTCLNDLKRYKLAISCFNKAMKLNYESMPDMFFNRADSNWKLGNYEGAITDLMRACCCCRDIKGAESVFCASAEKLILIIEDIKNIDKKEQKITINNIRKLFEIFSKYIEKDINNNDLLNFKHEINKILYIHE